jgi:Family of unknown function (DUF6152)
MRTARVIISVIAVGLWLSVSLAAHHGAAAFDVGKKVVLKGTVAGWIYSNPHCLLSLDVMGEDGKVVRWIAEGQAPNVVYPVGYRKDSFNFGDQVTVTVEPVKNGRPMGRILSAVLADGTALGVANSSGTPPQPSANPAAATPQ